MATIGSLIAIADYNNMRNKVLNVMGVGSNDFGYGQNNTFPAVAVGNSIDAANMVVLKNNIQIARRHQVGNATGFPVAELPDVAVGNLVTADVYNKYTTAITKLENERLPVKGGFFPTASYSIAGAGNSTPQTSTTTSPIWGGTGWNGAFVLEVQLTYKWANHNAARAFFNTGSSLRLTMTERNTGSMNQQYYWRDTEWKNLLESIGTVQLFAKYTQHSSNVGTSNNTGFYDLTDGKSAENNRIMLYNGTRISPIYNHIPGYTEKDSVYVYGYYTQGTAELRISVLCVEMNQHGMWNSPQVNWNSQYATTYLKSPTVSLPSVSSGTILRTPVATIRQKFKGYPL